MNLTPEHLEHLLIFSNDYRKYDVIEDKGFYGSHAECDLPTDIAELIQLGYLYYDEYQFHHVKVAPKLLKIMDKFV